jgi:hypothetical protein
MTRQQELSRLQQVLAAMDMKLELIEFPPPVDVHVRAAQKRMQEAATNLHVAELALEISE